MYSSPAGHPPWQSAYPSLNQQNHAYIPVPARNAFGPQPHLPPPPTYTPAPLPSQQYMSSPPTSTAQNTPPPEPQQPARQKIVWSADVRDYVNRSFAKAAEIRDVSKEQIETKLKEVITDATQSGKLDTINWKELPLPQQMIRDERSRALLAPITPPSYIPPVPVQAASTSSYHTHPDVPRKRKSTELSTDGETSAPLPPWRTNGRSSGLLADRVSFNPSEKRPKLDMNKSVSKTHASLESRRRRFEETRAGSDSPRTQESSRVASPEPRVTGPIVGRSQKLEKNYFRLTSAPNPDDVRPLDVLRKTLELLKKKWRTEGNYVYICDQFKSLRQDLTVQHIKNEFTTSVYEYHARIALEKGDLDKKEPAIKHALEVRSALALGNYHKFFKLYLAVPDMGAYLMDMFVERERLAALACLCKAYKPDVRLRFVTEELGFESDEEACQFILDHAPEESSNLLEERDGDVRFLTGKAGNIFHIAKNRAFGQVDIKGQI
ncbi:hypothetical protein CLAIMM_01595 [Cladophialophora immunda]|nr:hypothetical protein CLAIMM_01595 [Cladophialophora immunda]